jgi:hypothetical protein
MKEGLVTVVGRGVVRKTKGQIRIHSENLDKTSVSKPKKIFYSTYPDFKDLKVVLK